MNQNGNITDRETIIKRANGQFDQPRLVTINKQNQDFGASFKTENKKHIIYKIIKDLGYHLV